MDFWDVFWLLLIFIPLVLIWTFAIVDIFRREDIPGWAKALWMVCVVVAPFLGTLIYLIFRPQAAHPGALAVLADMHERGKLTDAEFAEEKARLVQ